MRPPTGPRLAQQSRNEIMMVVRTRSSPYGRARAVALKKRGKTIEELMDKYARLRFKRGFYDLSTTDQGSVYEDIVHVAGRPNPKVNAQAQMLGRLSKGFWVLTVVVIVWDVGTSTNKVEAAVRDMMGAAIGIVGSIAVGALAGAVFGPVGAIIGGVIGGILGGLISDTLLAWFEAHAPILTSEQAGTMMTAMP